MPIPARKGSLPESFVDAVRREATSQRVAQLLGLKLKGDGCGLCPFHEDATPSIQVFPPEGDDPGGWKCYTGCGSGGDGISLNTVRFAAEVGSCAPWDRWRLAGIIKTMGRRPGLLGRVAGGEDSEATQLRALDEQSRPGIYSQDLPNSHAQRKPSCPRPTNTWTRCRGYSRS